MHHNAPSSVDLEKVANDLAETAIVGRELREMRKQAAMPDLLGSLQTSLQSAGPALTNWAKSNPELAATLAGAGLGGVTGGAGSLLGRRRGEKRRFLGDALTGALSGAAIGGGGALLARNWSRQGSKTAPQTPSGGSGGSGAVPGGQNAVKLKPEALERAPELLDQVRKGRSDSMTTQIGDFLGNAYGNFRKDHPILSGLALTDAGLTAAGTGTNFLNRAIGKPVFSERFDDFFHGLQDVAKGEKGTRGVSAPEGLDNAARTAVNDKARLRKLFDQYLKDRKTNPRATFNFEQDIDKVSPETTTKTQQGPTKSRRWPDGRSQTIEGKWTKTEKVKTPKGRTSFRLDPELMADITDRGKPTVQWLDYPTVKATGQSLVDRIRKLTGRTASPASTATPGRLGRMAKATLGGLDSGLGWASRSIPVVRNPYARIGARGAAYAGIPLLAEAIKQYRADKARQALVDSILQDAVQ